MMNTIHGIMEEPEFQRSGTRYTIPSLSVESEFHDSVERTLSTVASTEQALVSYMPADHSSRWAIYYITSFCSTIHSLFSHAITLALHDVHCGMHLRDAARKHGVDKSTLQRRSVQIIPNPTYHSWFSEFDENLLATLLQGYAAFDTPLIHPILWKTRARGDLWIYLAD